MRESFIFYRSFYEALEGMDKESQADCLMALAKYALTGETGEMKPVVKMFLMMAKPQIDANNKRFENGCKGGEFGKLGGRPRKTPIEEKEENENPKITPKKPLKNPTETPKEPQQNPNGAVRGLSGVLKIDSGVFEKEKKISPLNPLEENKNILPPYTLKGVVPPKGDDPQIDLEEWIKENKQEPLPAKQTKFKKPTLDEVEAYMRESGYAVSADRFIAYYDSVGWKVGKNPMKDWKAALRGWAIREQARERTLRAASGLVGVRSETYGEGIPL